MVDESKIALTIQNISKSYGDHEVLHQIDLEQKDKEFLVLLGPSGCGKTTLLRIIAGLLTPNSGSVNLKDKDITNVPCYNRDIGMVFQNYALFPHMTVFQNVAFGLRMRKIPKNKIKQQVLEALQLVRLEQLENRSVKQLSGGQQQRVALARALVLNPSLLLLDEPLSNLDAKLRAQVRVEIAQIQRKLGLTAILVTHDQTEAMTMGDRIILMQNGIIQQTATPTEIYEQPTNLFVASFIGSPQINVFNITKSGNEVCFEELEQTVPLEKFKGLFFPDIGSENDLPDGKYELGVRPEDFVIDEKAGKHLFTGQVFFVENLGADYYLHTHAGSKTIVMRSPQDCNYSSDGCDLFIGFRPGKVHLFDGETHNRIHLA